MEKSLYDQKPISNIPLFRYLGPEYFTELKNRESRGHGNMAVSKSNAMGPFQIKEVALQELKNRYKELGHISKEALFDPGTSLKLASLYLDHIGDGMKPVLGKDKNPDPGLILAGYRLGPSYVNKILKTLPEDQRTWMGFRRHLSESGDMDGSQKTSVLKYLDTILMSAGDPQSRDSKTYNTELKRAQSHPFFFYQTGNYVPDLGGGRSEHADGPDNSEDPNNLGDLLARFKSLTGGIGSVMGTAGIANGDPTMGAVGSALSGFATAGLPGAVVQGGMGLISAYQNKANEELAMLESQEALRRSKSVGMDKGFDGYNQTLYQKGGPIKRRLHVIGNPNALNINEDIFHDLYNNLRQSDSLIKDIANTRNVLRQQIPNLDIPKNYAQASSYTWSGDMWPRIYLSKIIRDSVIPDSYLDEIDNSYRKEEDIVEQEYIKKYGRPKATFKTEYDRLSPELKKQYRDVSYTEINKQPQELEKILSGLSKNDQVMIMDHVGKNMLGIPMKELSQIFKKYYPKDNKNPCLWGACYGATILPEFSKDSGINTIGTFYDSWHGGNPGRKNVLDILFPDKNNRRLYKSDGGIDKNPRLQLGGKSLRKLMLKALNTSKIASDLDGYIKTPLDVLKANDGIFPEFVYPDQIISPVTKAKADKLKIDPWDILAQWQLGHQVGIDRVRRNQLGGKTLRTLFSKVLNKFKPTDLTKNQVNDDLYEYFKSQFVKPTLKNEEALNVLNNFKTRIQTPEGKKRLHGLGISNTDFLDKIQLIEDKDTLGHYNSTWNRIHLNPDLPEFSKVTRHELEHAVQRASINSKKDNTILPKNSFHWFTGNIKKSAKKILDDHEKALNSVLDNSLTQLDLRKVPEKISWEEFKKTRSKLDPANFYAYLNNRQHATNYFDSGSEGFEKAPFLAEVQQYMLDKKVIQHPYDNITPELVEDTFINSVNNGDSKFLRLFNIMKPTEANYNLIAKNLNKMLAGSPIIIGNATADNKQQLGSSIESNVNTTGYTPGTDSFENDINVIPSNIITMKNTPFDVLGIPNKGRAKLMKAGLRKIVFPDADYVTEIPMVQIGGRLRNPYIKEGFQAHTADGHYLEPNNFLVRPSTLELSNYTKIPGRFSTPDTYPNDINYNRHTNMSDEQHKYLQDAYAKLKGMYVETAKTPAYNSLEQSMYDQDTAHELDYTLLKNRFGIKQTGGNISPITLNTNLGAMPDFRRRITMSNPLNKNMQKLLTLPQDTLYELVKDRFKNSINSDINRNQSYAGTMSTVEPDYSYVSPSTPRESISETSYLPIKDDLVTMADNAYKIKSLMEYTKSLPNNRNPKVLTQILKSSIPTPTKSLRKTISTNLETLKPVKRDTSYQYIGKGLRQYLSKAEFEYLLKNLPKR